MFYYTQSSCNSNMAYRALQLHPNVPSLYILAAQHELAHLSPSAARVLLQRCIRLNAESVDMWREYVKFELGFVESMRRRWELLGIDMNGKGKANAQANVEDGMNEGDVEQLQAEADADEGGGEAEEARRAIMQGAIVKSVISNSVKGAFEHLGSSSLLLTLYPALPKAPLFVSLHELLSTYPTTLALRSSLLDHLHTLLLQTLPTDPIAIRLTATRHLLPELSGDALVDALRDANDKMTAAVREACSDDSRKNADDMAGSYADFVKEWVQREDVDDSLVSDNITIPLAYDSTAYPSLVESLPLDVSTHAYSKASQNITTRYPSTFTCYRALPTRLTSYTPSPSPFHEKSHSSRCQVHLVAEGQVRCQCLASPFGSRVSCERR